MTDKLIQKWAVKLSEKLNRPVEEILSEGLSLGDFNSEVEIKFQDGSHAFFKYAFFVVDTKEKLCAIFSEHCGYLEISSVAVQIKETSETRFIDELYEEY